MNIQITDNCVSLEESGRLHTLLEKPEFPDYSNVTARPHFTWYYIESETIWDRFCFCMENLPVFCPEDPYFGCYALMFCRLYRVLLSDNRAKNVAAYGPSADCGAYRVFQDFMTFLHEGNSLTALAQSPFSFTALNERSCLALLYRLDTCSALTAVCDAMEKVRPGGLILLYTLQDALPDWLVPLCQKAEKDNFSSCTVYALTMDEDPSAFAGANGSGSFVLSRAEEILKRAGDLRNLIQAMLAGAALPGDAYAIAALILQQTEEILLSVYDYLDDDDLPIHTNALKEAVLNYYVGVSGQYDSDTYRKKLTQSSEIFFTAIEREFQ